MAFLDFREFGAGLSTPRGASRASLPSVAEEGFTSGEWQVIRLARHDGLGSLRAPGALARLGGLVFGESRNPRLADPRLETLRAVAVHAWHRGYAIPVSAIAAFREAGFTLDQLETMLASIGAGRLARR